MSTLTISAPIAAPRGVRARTAVASGSGGQRSIRRQQPRLKAPADLVSSRRGPVAAAGPRGGATLRLTRRGRLVILLVLLVVGAAVSLAVTASGAASGTVQQVPMHYVTVAPGDTLWSIAGEVAPDADRRDTIAEILELNALAGSSVTVGQRIAVPQDN